MMYWSGAFALGAALTVATAPAEAGWRRSTTAVGPNGGITTVNASGSCNGGACNWSRERIGPRGGVTTTQGSAVRTAPGQWNAAATTTGPRGRSVTRSSTVSYWR